ncbi:hypothetical protein KIN20_002697 [Parelaphostrongylus tenuis]|uniref:Uncharacterized protein n=1 Tax=Parelaphostrongylus tenuis TaxID=148309 RepID=A0AAD5MH15_PARTN|nr:hypothetical protein KIN20_002697 [Parelaphostrongylus tenuis]
MALDGSQCGDDKGKLECDEGRWCIELFSKRTTTIFYTTCNPLVKINPSSPHARSSDQLLAHVPVSLSYSNSKVQMSTEPGKGVKNVNKCNILYRAASKLSVSPF